MFSCILSFKVDLYHLLSLFKYMYPQCFCKKNLMTAYIICSLPYKIVHECNNFALKLMFTTISFLILRTIIFFIGKRNFQSDRAILSALELSRIPREFRQYLEVLLAVNFTGYCLERKTISAIRVYFMTKIAQMPHEIWVMCFWKGTF